MVTSETSLAKRILDIGHSSTMRIASTTIQMKADGIDVIDLCVGEPNFPTPENVKNAAKRAIDDDFTKYTANEGYVPLKQAVIRRYREDHNLEYKPDEIIISTGAKNCLYNACAVLINKGDEVIIPAPYWVSYPHMVRMMQGVPVIVETSEKDDLQLTPKKFKAAITPKTKALLLNNPSNPSGIVYSRQQLEALAEIAVAESVIVLTDEVYEKLVYDGIRNTCFASINEQAKAQTIVVNGVSKAYAMTGWRLGYAVGPRELIRGMAKIQSHSTSNACSISQIAAIEALDNAQSDVAKMVAAYQQRRDYMLSRLLQIPHVSCAQAQGAFYLFPNFSAYYDTEYQGNVIRTSQDLAYYLLTQARVALVPGDAFGMGKFIRFSYSASMKNIKIAMERVAEAISKLQPVSESNRNP
ncbi:pyridoxal phosphate-dependent aminotransferase [candidate division KSB1 bacterium]|nr:pyridoxal phosphate-dependent aminotransferase [candidate division KSB1 bacterium]